jgi:hypothetical protein
MTKFLDGYDIREDGDGWFMLFRAISGGRGWLYMGRFQNRLLALREII